MNYLSESNVKKWAEAEAWSSSSDRAVIPQCIDCPLHIMKGRRLICNHPHKGPLRTINTICGYIPLGCPLRLATLATLRVQHDY